MRNAWPKHVAVIAVAVFALAGCSNTQPEQASSGTATLRFGAQADGPLQDCYELWQNGAFTGFYGCSPAPVSDTRRVPWNYSLQISVIHAGTTSEVIVVSADGHTVGSSVEPGNTHQFISLTGYDPSDSVPLPDLGPDADGISRVNGKRLSVGNELYLNHYNSFGVGTSNILGLPGPTRTTAGTFVFNTLRGDTIIVRARKQTTTQSPPFLSVLPAPALLLNAILTIGGSEVTTGFQGALVTTADDYAGLTFSYIVR